MQYREIRHATDREVRVALGGIERRVRLVNISATGARLRQMPPLPPGTVVTLCHLQLRVQAKVVWSNELQTGVRFASPLKPADMQALGGLIVKTQPRPAHGFREVR